jgi:polysaccharide deacetylase 2 family uncharacterized protein YibQ
MSAKPRRPAARGKSKKGSRRSLGPLLVVGLLLFAGGVYFGGRLQHHGGVTSPPSTAVKAPAARPRTGAPRGAANEPSPEASSRPLPPRGGKPVRVALVIDDLGRSLDELAQLEHLGVPLTYAVLPFESLTPRVVEALNQRHLEMLCHLPMEAERGNDPGPGALRLGMSPDQLVALTRSALAAVPGAVGVNNHMGSALSADRASMRAIVQTVGEKDLFFLDSRTSAESVGYDEAMRQGVPAAQRNVFLDDDLRPEAIAEQFRRLLEVASEKGVAIAIGHPHPATLEMLAREVPRAKSAGYEFVPLSYLVDRRDVAPE